MMGAGFPVRHANSACQSLPCALLPLESRLVTLPTGTVLRAVNAPRGYEASTPTKTHTHTPLYE